MLILAEAAQINDGHLIADVHAFPDDVFLLQVNRRSHERSYYEYVQCCATFAVQMPYRVYLPAHV